MSVEGTAAAAVWMATVLAMAMPLSCVAQPQAMPSLAARLSGKGLPDFTVTYRCRRHNKFPHMTVKQAEALTRARFASSGIAPHLMGKIVKNLARYGLEDVTEVDRNPEVDITISQRGSRRMYVSYFWKGRGKQVVVYDGTRTLGTSVASRDRGDGGYLMVEPGLDYSSLRCFVFPGFGVAGIPLATKPVPSRTQSHRYDSLVGFNDGWITSGDPRIPDYLPGVVRTADFDGTEVIVETVSGVSDHEARSYRTTYSRYTRLGPRLLLPSFVQLRLTYNPSGAFTRGEWYVADYTLISASPTPLPAQEFDIDRYVAGHSFVHGDRRPGSRISVHPGRKTLDQQFDQILTDKKKLASFLAQGRAMNLALAASRRRKPGSRTAGIVVGVIAVAAALFGALRFSRARRGA